MQLQETQNGYVTIHLAAIYITMWPHVFYLSSTMSFHLVYLLHDSPIFAPLAALSHLRLSQTIIDNGRLVSTFSHRR